MNPITLRDGKTVEIAAFHCQAICTYISEAGVLEGSPKSLNRFRERERAGQYMETRRAAVLKPWWLGLEPDARAALPSARVAPVR